MNKVLPMIFVSFLICSCGNTKYTYHFEKQKNIDFSSGKWILNEPYTNNGDHRIKDISIKRFEEILKDSLYEINELRKDKLVGTSFPFEPSHKDLRDFQIATGCDYLINIKSNIVKDEMGSFAHAPNIGSTKKTNQAESEIRFYDLNKLTLLSKWTIIGKAEIIKNADDGSWDYVNTGKTISWNGLNKLIGKINKNKVRP